MRLKVEDLGGKLIIGNTHVPANAGTLGPRSYTGNTNVIAATPKDNPGNPGAVFTATGIIITVDKINLR